MNLVKQILDKIKQLIPDKTYLELQYKYHLGEKLNLESPKTFNEKLQWLKLYDRKPEYTMYADKYAVREHIKNLIGEKYLIPLIGVYDRVEDIDWDRLPNRFVLKCTHGSSCNIICDDKSRLDITSSKKKLKKWMNRNWYWYGREWPYKNVKPRIICEKYIVDEFENGLRDYKIFCFNGNPKIIQVISERKGSQYCVDHFDLNWEKIQIPRKNHQGNKQEIGKPVQLKKMIDIAKILSKGMPFVRIDLYNTQSQILFGEITFYPVSGFMDFEDKKHDNLLGSWIELPFDK